MNTKKYIVAWILWLILTVVIWVFIYKEHSQTELENHVISKIPWNFTQSVHISFDDNMVDFINESPQEIAWLDWILELTENINSITIFQISDQEYPYSFILFDAPEAFDIQYAVDAWLVADSPNFLFEEIEDEVYLYADQQSFDYLEDYNDHMLYENDDFEEYIDSIVSWENNFWFFSRADQQAASELDLPGLVPYLDELWYSLIVWNLSSSSSNALVSIIFEDEFDFVQSYNFQSVFDWLATEDTIAYLELGSIVDLLWVESSIFWGLIEDALSPTLSQMWVNLTSSNYQSLASALDGNIGFILNSWNNELWIWARFIFNWTGVHDFLSQFNPYLNQLIATLDFEWEISSFEDENEFWVEFTVPYVMDIALQSNITVSTDWEFTYIDVLEPNFDWDDIDMHYDNDSILWYYSNLSNLFDAAWPLGWFQAIWFNEEQFDFFSEKVIYWSLDVKWNELIFRFNME